MTPREQQTIDFPEVPLYRPYQTASDAYARIGNALAREIRRVRVRVVVSALGLGDLAASLGGEVDDASIATTDDGEVAHLRLEREWGRNEVHHASGDVLVIQATRRRTVFAYQIICACPYSFWDRVLGHAVRQCYPRVSRPSLSTKDIYSLIMDLAGNASINPQEVRVTSMSLHSRIGDPTASSETQVERVWTDLALPYAFESIRAQNAALIKVYFSGRGSQGTGIAGHIGRDGEIGIESGFGAFRTSVLNPCAALALSRFTQLDDRARVREHGFATRPFFIEFDAPVFQSSDRQARFVEVLESMPHASHAVIHSNPYVHVALFDRLEETSCDIYVLSDRRVSVVPQTRSSATALTRLYEHISTEFNEGEVRDYGEVYA